VVIWRGFPGGVLTAQFYNLYTLRRIVGPHAVYMRDRARLVYNGNCLRSAGPAFPYSRLHFCIRSMVAHNHRAHSEITSRKIELLQTGAHMQEIRAGRGATRKERNHMRINPACDDAGWKKDRWPKVDGAKKLSSAHSLPPPPLERDSTQLYSCKRASHERPTARLLLVHIRINFPTLFPIVCRRLFLGPRQRLLISICSPTNIAAASRPKDRPANTLELDPKSCAQRE
jgi:hypothetical protein